jgi:hypothetical protein
MDPSTIEQEDDDSEESFSSVGFVEAVKGRKISGMSAMEPLKEVG